MNKINKKNFENQEFNVIFKYFITKIYLKNFILIQFFESIINKLSFFLYFTIKNRLKNQVFNFFYFIIKLE